MIVYILIFCLCILLYILSKFTKYKKNAKIMEIFILICLILLSGTRYKLGGWDYEIYHNIFKSAPKLNEFSFNTTILYNTEIGYFLLNSIIKTIGFNFYGFTLIHSIIFYYLLYKGVKKFDIDFSFFLIVFLYKSCIFNTFVSLRQSLVLVIFLNALGYLRDGKKVKYLLLILLCTTLHTSSIILFPLVFIDKIKLSRKQLLLYGLVFFIFFVLNITSIYKLDVTSLIYKVFPNNTSIINKTIQYGSSIKEISVLSTIESYVIFLGLLLLYNSILKNINKERIIMINLFLIIIPIVTIFRSFEVMIRFRDYFSFFVPFILFYIVEQFKNKDKFLITVTIFFVSFVGYYRYIYTYDNGTYALKHYQSYIFEEISIFGNE